MLKCHGSACVAFEALGPPLLAGGCVEQRHIHRDLLGVSTHIALDDCIDVQQARDTVERDARRNRQNGAACRDTQPLDAPYVRRQRLTKVISRSA